mgnify:CR=1 FL=1
MLLSRLIKFYLSRGSEKLKVRLSQSVGILYIHFWSDDLQEQLYKAEITIQPIDFSIQKHSVVSIALLAFVIGLCRLSRSLRVFRKNQ